MLRLSFMPEPTNIQDGIFEYKEEIRRVWSYSQKEFGLSALQAKPVRYDYGPLVSTQAEAFSDAFGCIQIRISPAGGDSHGPSGRQVIDHFLAQKLLLTVNFKNVHGRCGSA